MKKDLYSEGMAKPGLKRLLNPTIALIALLFIILLPFAILSFFSHPQADDFSAATTTMRLGYFRAVAAVYKVWNGRWFSTAVMQANPISYGGIASYKMVPLAFFVLFFWSMFAFAKTVFPRTGHLRESCLCALVLMALYLSAMPSVVQGFYWMSGAVNYQLANILMVFLWAHIIRIMDAPAKKPAKWRLAAAVILIFAVIGSNETSMALTLFMIAVALVWRSIKKHRIDPLFAGFFVAAVFASAIVVIAPGNYVRMAQSSHAANLMETARKTVSAIAVLTYHQATHPLLIISTVAAIPFFAAKVRDSSEPRTALNPVVSLSYWIGAMLVTIVPAAHLFPGRIPDRVLNVTSLLFLIGWFLILNEMVRYFMPRRSLRIPSFPASVNAVLVVLALVALTGKNNIKETWSSFVSGAAHQYDEQLTRRYAELKHCHRDTCVVAPLSVFPRILFYQDINEDPDSWINRPYAEYFGKRAILLGKPDHISGE